MLEERMCKRELIFAEMWEKTNLRQIGRENERVRRSDTGQGMNLEILNNHLTPSVALPAAIISNRRSFIPSFYFVILF